MHAQRTVCTTQLSRSTSSLVSCLVRVPLVVDAVIGLTLGLIAHVVIVVFVVAILRRIFRMRLTLRRNAMTTPASVHCVSRQLMFSDLSRTGFRRKIWHPRHHCLVTIHIIPHWIMCSSWDFWISCSSWNFWIPCSSWNLWILCSSWSFWILQSYRFGPSRQLSNSECPDNGIASILFSLGFT